MNRDICLGTNISSVDFNQLFNNKKKFLRCYFCSLSLRTTFFLLLTNRLMVTYEAQDTRPDRGLHIEFYVRLGKGKTVVLVLNVNGTSFSDMTLIYFGCVKKTM